MNIENESHPAQSIVVYSSNYDIEKEWKQYSKKNLKISWKGRTGILVSKECNVPAISMNQVNLYSKVESGESESRILIAAEISEGQFDERGSAGKILVDFASEHYLKIVEKDLLEYSKQLKVLNNELEKSISEREDLEKMVIKDSKALSDEQKSVLDSREKIEKEEVNIQKADKTISKNLTKGEADAEKNEKLVGKKAESNQSIADYETGIQEGSSKIAQLVSDIENYNRQKQELEAVILGKQSSIVEITAAISTLENYAGLLRKKI